MSLRSALASAVPAFTAAFIAQDQVTGMGVPMDFPLQLRGPNFHNSPRNQYLTSIVETMESDEGVDIGISTIPKSGRDYHTEALSHG
jgi:hypothetical protein